MKRYYSNTLSNLPGVFLLLLAVMIPALCTQAQKVKQDSTLNRTVVVENEYNPDIMDATKINVLPAIEEPVVKKKEIEYSTTEVPTQNYGDYQPVPSLFEPVEKKAERGYASLGYGNYGNLKVRGNYLFDLSKRDDLGIGISSDGMNGTLKATSPFGNGDIRKWESHFYRTKAHADYSHRFNKVGLDISGAFGADNFNYIDKQLFRENVYSGNLKTNQRFLTGAFLAGLTGTDRSLPLLFTAQAGYLYAGKKFGWENEEADPEHRILAKVDVWGNLSESGKVGVEFDVNSFFYSFPGRKEYTSLEMNPYYTVAGESWAVRAGAHVDLSFGKGNVFEVSPDIHVQYLFSDSYMLYLSALGGRVLNDYRKLQSETPYWAAVPSMNWENTYIPLDAQVGFKASPAVGLRVAVWGGYQIRNNDLCFSNYLPEDMRLLYNDVLQTNTKVLSAGLELNYNHRDIFDFSGKATYSHWSADNSRMLTMKPETELEFNVGVKPVAKWHLFLSYNFTSRHKAVYEDAEGLFPEKQSYRMNPVNNLSIGADYTFWKELSVFVQANNVLNSKYENYLFYPAQRLNFLAGFSFTF